MKLWYGSKCYETFLISHSLKFRAIPVDFKVFKTECIKAICVPNGANLTRREIDDFTEKAKKEGAGGLAYILYVDGGILAYIGKQP